MTRLDHREPLTPEQQALVVDNLPLVKWTIKVFGAQSAYEDFDDNYQAGVLGLMRAAQAYDPAGGSKFSPFAVNAIRWGIQQGQQTARGCNYRRAVNNGEKYEQPIHIDQPLEFDADVVGIQLAEAEPYEPPTDDPRLLSLRDRMTADEWQICTQRADEAAHQLRVKVESVKRRYWRIVSRLKKELAA